MLAEQGMTLSIKKILTKVKIKICLTKQCQTNVFRWKVMTPSLKFIVKKQLHPASIKFFMDKNIQRHRPTLLLHILAPFLLTKK